MNLDRDSVLEALLEEPPTYLIVAIDGLEDATNSRFRVGARLEPILRGVRRLAALKRQRGAALPVLHMRFIVMKHNEHELPSVEAFAHANDFELLTIRTLSIIDTDRPDRVHSGFVPLQKLWRAYDYRGETRLHRPDFVCQQPFWFPTVFADGTVVGCEQDYNAQQALGRFPEDGSFADIWYSNRAAEVRRRIRDHPCDLSFCRNCPYADRATTDCSVEGRPVRPSFTFPVLSSKAI
jgi:radical SAM protein with 4Fe4S-binding SPASM domain